MTNRSVLVTLADEKRIIQAKQLFSSAYFSGDWRGDFLLLSHSVPDAKLAWFKKHGIIVKKCKPIVKRVSKRTGVHSSKLYLFTKEVKKWKKVLYLDTDIIVRASLLDLLKVNDLSATPDVNNQLLMYQLHLNSNKTYHLFNKISKAMNKTFDLTSPSFNAGVIAFDTKIIKTDTFHKLKTLLIEYGSLCSRADQTILNIFFYKRWKSLPRVYNLQPEVYANLYGVPYTKIIGIILHFASDLPTDKPWRQKNWYHGEWKKNLDNAELLNIRENVLDSKMWTPLKTTLYEVFYFLCRQKRWLSVKEIVYVVNAKQDYIKRVIKKLIKL